MKMRSWRIHIVAVLIVGAAMPSATHAAPGSCWAGPTVTDWLGRKHQTRVCPTWTGTNLLDIPQEGTTKVGYLNAGNNWVVCQSYGGANPQLGGTRNHWWLYTQADTVSGYPERKGWGWLPATAVSYGGDEEPIPDVPACPPPFAPW